MLTNQFLILDLLTALWVCIIFVILFVWLPTKSESQTGDLICDRLVGASARIVLATVAGVSGLTVLGLFNWFTLVLLYVGCLLITQLNQHHWQVRELFRLVCVRFILVTADFLDPEALQKSQKLIYKIWFTQKQRLFNKIRSDYLNNLQGMIFGLGLLTIFCFAAYKRFEYPLMQLRLGNPNSYQTLLVTREILAGDLSYSYIPVIPSLAATISLLGAIAPMQVVRFFGAIIGLLLVLSVGYSVCKLTKNRIAALVAMFSLGAYLFTWVYDMTAILPTRWQQVFTTVTESLNQSLVRQWTGGELEIGAIFLLCALARFSEVGRKQQKTAFVDGICCLAIVVITAPALLIIAVFSQIGIVVGSKMSGAIAGITWLILAFAAAIPQNGFDVDQSFLLTLPVALSLLSGLFFALLTSFGRLVFGSLSESISLFLVLTISFNCLLSPKPKIFYLEYEIAARKALELEALFPAKQWMLVAPVEQFSQIYGTFYEDLGLFVDKYSALVKKADFQFPFSIPDLFIFVEKIPFATYPIEAPEVSPSMLYDPVYRYYRSNAGRASLQFNALRMCETYRNNHPNSSIYYEDDILRIYHFRPLMHFLQK